ncbi:MAG TPA: 50S ribosomal protein L23 [Trueperaceae bacterium]
MNAFDIIIAPVLSEKAVSGIENSRYTFFVHPHANRTQVKEAVQQVFDVDVVKINLVNVKGKTKRMGRFEGREKNRKKAIVTLKPGQRIQQLEGLT